MSITLTQLAAGRSGRISSIAVTGPHARRVRELGLRPGVTCRVITRTSGGGLVVAVLDGRLGLDRATADAVSVTPLDEEPRR